MPRRHREPQLAPHAALPERGGSQPDHARLRAAHSHGHVRATGQRHVSAFGTAWRVGNGFATGSAERQSKCGARSAGTDSWDGGKTFHRHHGCLRGAGCGACRVRRKQARRMQFRRQSRPIGPEREGHPSLHRELPQRRRARTPTYRVRPGPGQGRRQCSSRRRSTRSSPSYANLRTSVEAAEADPSPDTLRAAGNALSTFNTDVGSLISDIQSTC